MIREKTYIVYAGLWVPMRTPSPEEKSLSITGLRRLVYAVRGSKGKVIDCTSELLSVTSTIERALSKTPGSSYSMKDYLMDGNTSDVLESDSLSDSENKDQLPIRLSPYADRVLRVSDTGDGDYNYVKIYSKALTNGFHIKNVSVFRCPKDMYGRNVYRIVHVPYGKSIVLDVADKLLEIMTKEGVNPEEKEIFVYPLDNRRRELGHYIVDNYKKELLPILKDVLGMSVSFPPQ